MHALLEWKLAAPDPDGADELRRLAAYRKAPDAIRAIVDTALGPYEK